MMQAVKPKSTKTAKRGKPDPHQQQNGDSTNNSGKPSRSCSRQRGQIKSNNLGNPTTISNHPGSQSNSTSFGWRNGGGSGKDFNFAGANEYDLPAVEKSDLRTKCPIDNSDTACRALTSKRRDGVSQTSGFKLIKSKKLVSQNQDNPTAADSIGSRKLDKDNFASQAQTVSDKKKRKIKVVTEGSKISNIGTGIEQRLDEKKKSLDRERYKPKHTRSDPSPESVGATPVMKPKGFFKSNHPSRSTSRTKSKHQTRHGSPGGSGFARSDDIIEDVKVSPHLLAPIISVLSKIQILQKQEQSRQKKHNLESKVATNGKITRNQSQTRTRSTSNVRLNFTKENHRELLASRRSSSKKPKSRSRSKRSEKTQQTPKSQSKSKNRTRLFKKERELGVDTSENMYYTGKSKKKLFILGNTGSELAQQKLANQAPYAISEGGMTKPKSKKIAQKLLAKKQSAGLLTNPIYSPIHAIARPQTPPAKHTLQNINSPAKKSSGSKVALLQYGNQPISKQPTLLTQITNNTNPVNFAPKILQQAPIFASPAPQSSIQKPTITIPPPTVIIPSRSPPYLPPPSNTLPTPQAAFPAPLKEKSFNLNPQNLQDHIFQSRQQQSHLSPNHQPSPGKLSINSAPQAVLNTSPSHIPPPHQAIQILQPQIAQSPSPQTKGIPQATIKASGEDDEPTCMVSDRYTPRRQSLPKHLQQHQSNQQHEGSGGNQKSNTSNTTPRNPTSSTSGQQLNNVYSSVNANTVNRSPTDGREMQGNTTTTCSNRAGSGMSQGRELSKDVLMLLLAEARTKHIEREMLEILKKVVQEKPVHPLPTAPVRDSVKLEDSIHSVLPHSVEPIVEIKEVFSFTQSFSLKKESQLDGIQKNDSNFSSVEQSKMNPKLGFLKSPIVNSNQQLSNSLGRLDYLSSIAIKPKVLNIDMVNLTLAAQSNDLSRHSSQYSAKTDNEGKNAGRSRTSNQPISPNARFEEVWVNPPPQPIKGNLLLQIKERTETSLKAGFWPQRVAPTNTSDDCLSQGNRSEGSFSVSTSLRHQGPHKAAVESSEGSQTKNILIRDEVNTVIEQKVPYEDSRRANNQNSDEKWKNSEDTDKDSSEPPNSIRIPASALLEGIIPSGLGSPESSDNKQDESPVEIAKETETELLTEEKYELDDDFEGPTNQTLAITPLLLDNLSPDTATFTSLSPEDQACSIGDFILENLLIEVFACGTENFLSKILTAGKKLSSKLANKENVEVSRYLSQVFTIINDSPEYQLEIYTRLNTPVLHSDAQRLLLAAPGLPAEALEGAATMGYESVLNIQLYIQLEELLRDTEYASRGLGLAEVEREHIHHKLLFDALNEQLDYSRAGGLKGLPPSFFQEYKTPRRISPEDCAHILESAKAVVMNWTSERAGLLSEHLPSSEPPEALELVREEVLLKQLSGYAHTLEEKWAEFSDEQLEVILNIADQLEEDLILEAVADVLKISSNNTIELKQ